MKRGTRFCALYVLAYVGGNVARENLERATDSLSIASSIMALFVAWTLLGLAVYQTVSGES